MTSVDISKVNNTVVVSVAGHAEYNPGNDVVCAGLSTLTQSLFATLEYYESKNKCCIKSKQIKEDIGTALISFTYSSEKEIEAVINMAVIGFSMLANTYPKNIFINCEL